MEVDRVVATLCMVVAEYIDWGGGSVGMGGTSGRYGGRRVG